jgi:hypothetical protein
LPSPLSVGPCGAMMELAAAWGRPATLKSLDRLKLQGPAAQHSTAQHGPVSAST